MRVVVVTIVILIIFIAGTFMLDNYINNSCDDLLEDIKALNKLIEEKEWNKAKDELFKVRKEWESTKKSWQLFLEHYEMDSMDIAIVRLDQYVKIEDRSLALGEIAELELLISHIKGKESLKLQNIF